MVERRDHCAAYAGSSGWIWLALSQPSRKVERVMGIEPTLVAWEATVLPLNYTRCMARILGSFHRVGKLEA